MLRERLTSTARPAYPLSDAEFEVIEAIRRLKTASAANGTTGFGTLEVIVQQGEIEAWSEKVTHKRRSAPMRSG